MCRGDKIKLQKLINFSIIAFIIFLSCKYLVNIATNLSLHEIFQSFNTIQSSCIVAAISITIINYLIVICYDFSVASHLKFRIPFKHLSLISLITFIINNNLGFGAFLGGSMRYRFFSRLNIKVKDIAKYLVIFSWVYWVGLIFLSGIIFLLVTPDYIIKLPFTPIKLKGYNVGVLAVFILIIFGAISVFKDSFNLKWKILFPIVTTEKFIILTIISTLDWILLAFVFYFLLPEHKLNFIQFLPIFLVAQIGAVTSHVPAGFGVFDSIIIFYFKDIFNINALVSSLILFRVVYYLLPMIVAVMLFIIYENKLKNTNLKD